MKYRTTSLVHSTRCVQAAYEPESLPSLSTSSVGAADWSGDLLALAIFEDALETKGAGRRIILVCPAAMSTAA